MTVERLDPVWMTLQGLLCHVWRCRDARVAEEAELFPAGWLIPYKGLIELGPLPGLIPVQMGRMLRGVGAFCAENGWPPLPALVVNAERRRPGRGYFAAQPMGSRDATGWKVEDFRRCVEEAGELPRVAPWVRLDSERRREGEERRLRLMLPR